MFVASGLEWPCVCGGCTPRRRIVDGRGGALKKSLAEGGDIDGVSTRSLSRTGTSLEGGAGNGLFEGFTIVAGSCHFRNDRNNNLGLHLHPVLCILPPLDRASEHSLLPSRLSRPSLALPCLLGTRSLGRLRGSILSSDLLSTQILPPDSR